MNKGFFFLYGPSGAGKSTIGQKLAAELALPFLDLDEVIEQKAGTSIPEIFAVEQESGFRKWEREALGEILNSPGGVIALGGGALLSEENRSLAEMHGKVICLTAPLESLFERLETDSTKRPLLEGDAKIRLKHLLEERTPHYESFSAKLAVGSLSVEEAVWEAQVLLGVFRVRGMGNGYDVRVQLGGLNSVGEALRARGLIGPVGLVSDENVAPLYAESVRRSLLEAGFELRSVILSPGETYKTIKTVHKIWEGFLKGELERGSTVVALGGGVVGDLAGFAAATYLRGISWVVLPTTLLAMVDASLGGKTGADLPEGKNLVGAFHAPRLVLADPTSLMTLPFEELRSGMAEVVKHGVIGDPSLFESCGDITDLKDLTGLDEIVRRAMAVKIKVIQADPFEGGLRAALNLGHTVGHGVELASNYRLRHGEAVAIGMVTEARMAERMGLAAKGLSAVISGCLKNLGLPTEIPASLRREDIVRAMKVDKKKTSGKVLFALPVRIGEVKVGVPVNDLMSVIYSN